MGKITTKLEILDPPLILIHPSTLRSETTTSFTSITMTSLPETGSIGGLNQDRFYLPRCTTAVRPKGITSCPGQKRKILPNVTACLLLIALLPAPSMASASRHGIVAGMSGDGSGVNTFQDLQAYQKQHGLSRHDFDIMEKPLAAGAMGNVYSAKFNGSDLQVAIKKYNIYGSLSYRDVKREYDLQEGFNSPHVAKQLIPWVERDTVLDRDDPKIKYVDGDVVYSVLELCGLGDLHYLLNAKGPMRVPLVRYYLASLIRGLEEIHHNRIIHRDLKPANIVFDQEGVLKIIDAIPATEAECKPDVKGCFCVTKVPKRLGFFGTNGYVAPEVLKMKVDNIKYRFREGTPPQYGTASDVYSIGCVLVAMLTKWICFGPEDGDIRDTEKYVTGLYKKMKAWQWKGTDVTGWCKFGNLGLGFLKCISPLQTENRWLANHTELKADPELHHLIKKMLKFDPESRWTLQQIKEHDFFTKHEHWYLVRPGSPFFRWFDEHRPLPTLYEMARTGMGNITMDDYEFMTGKPPASL